MRIIGNHRRRRGTSSSAPVNLLLAVALVGGLAQDHLAAQESGRLKIAYVPADEPNAWPEGNWSLIATGDLLRFQDGSGSPGVLADGVLERAVYRGRMSPGDGLAGACEWTVMASAPQGGFVDLGEPTLSLEQLTAGGEPTVWGTSPDDRRLLLAPPGRSAVAGRWSARGRFRFEHFECDFEVPPAGMNRLELSAPAEWALLEASGVIIGPHPTTDPAMRRWDVELGRRTRCWLHWGQAASLQPRSELQCERTLTYSIRPDGSRLQADFSIRAHGSVPAQLTFRVPPQLAPPTVSWSTGTYLPGRPDDSDAERFVVPMPALNPGHLGTLRIVADMPTIEDADWLLPEVELEEGRLMGGTRVVAVDRPLTMKNYDVSGLRAVGVDDDERGTDWSFSEQRHDGSLAVRVGRPAPQFFARIATKVDRQNDLTAFESIVEISTRAGSGFSAEFQFPAGWDVLDVEAINAESALTGWRSEEAGSGLRLVVEFRQAIYGQSEKTLRIVGRGPLAGTPEPMPIPVEFVDWSLLWSADAAGGAESAQPLGESSEHLLSLLSADASASNWQVFSPASMTRAPEVPDAPPRISENQSPAPVRRAEPAGTSVASLCLETWIVPGESWRCRHRATLAVQGATSGLQFTMDPSATLDAVLVDGMLHATDSRGQTTVLAPLPAQAETIQVRYHTEAAEAGPLSTRLRVVVPAWNMPVGEAEWRVHVPEELRSFIGDEPGPLPWSARLFGWAGRFEQTPHRAAPPREITYRTVPCPQEFVVHVWNGRQRALAYVMTVLITVFTAFVIRLSLTLQSAVWYAVGIGSAACMAWLGPPVAAPIFGGVVVGLIVGGMIPRRWITVPERAWRAPQSPPGSSLQVARLVLLVFGVATTLVAQQPIDPEVEERAPAVAVDALIPIDDAGASRYSYLDAGLVPEVQRWIADHPARPSTLIRSARYESSASDPALIHANFEVVALSEAASLRLPLDDVTFRSPDDCFVDGQRRTIRPAADGNGYFVDLDAPLDADGLRVVEVSLWMRFRESAAPDRQEIAASIPRVIDSAVRINGRSAPRMIDPLGTFDPERGVDRFGGLRRLRLTHNPDVTRTLRGTAATMVEVHPLRLEVQTRLRVERASEDRFTPLRRASVLLPPHATVGEITGGGVQRSRAWSAGHKTIVDVVFGGVEAAEDLVDLKYTIPIEAEPTGIEIPPLQLLEGGGLTRHDIGIRAGGGFVIEQAPPTLPPETIAARFPREAGWTAPEVAVSVDAPAPIAVSLSRRETRLEANVSETVVVEDDRVSWEAAIDVDVSNSGTLRLVASIPEDVRVDACAVLQDGANRLLGWARDGESVVMHLREDRIGAYEVVMAGGSIGEHLVRVPKVELVGATVVGREFLFRNESRDRIEWLDGDQAPIPEASDTATSDDHADKRPVFLRRTRTRDQFNTLTTVGNQADGVSIVTYVQLDGSDKPPTVSLEVPPEIAAEARVEPQEWLRQSRATRDGGLMLTIEPDPGATHITVTTTATAEVIRGPLRAPRVVGADVLEQWIAIPATSRLEPGGSSSSSIDIDEVPGDLQGLIAPSAKVYRAAAPEWRLHPRTEVSVAVVDLVETGVWETPDGFHGRTLVHARSDGAGMLRIRRPQSVRIDSVLLNGRSIAPTESDGRHVSVHLGAADGLHQLLLRWTADGGDADSLEVPVPVDQSDFPHFAAIVVPTRQTVVAVEGSLSESELRTQRVDALLSSLESVSDESAAGAAGVLQTLRVDLATSETPGDGDEADRSEQWARWETLHAAAPEALKSDACPQWAIPTGIDAGHLIIRKLDRGESHVVIPEKSWIGFGMTPLIGVFVIAAALVLAVRFRVQRFDSDGRRLVLLGALWWMCFRLAPLGLVVMAVGIAVELMDRRRAIEHTEQPAS